jgi:hypothetical protein
MDRNALIDELIDAGADDSEIEEAVQLAESREPKVSPAPVENQSGMDRFLGPIAAPLKTAGQTLFKDLPEQKDIFARTTKGFKGATEFGAGVAALPFTAAMGAVNVAAPETSKKIASGAATIAKDAMTQHNAGLNDRYGFNPYGGPGKSIGIQSGPDLPLNPYVEERLKDVGMGALNLTGIGGGKAAFDVAAKAAHGTAKGVNKVVGTLAEESSGVSQPALRMMGTEKGREGLKANFGTQHEIGQELVKNIYGGDVWNNMPKGQEIRAVLKEVPGVDVNNLTSKVKMPESTVRPESQAAAQKLYGHIEDFYKMVDETGTIPAEKLFLYRQEIDNVLQDANAFGNVDKNSAYIAGLKGIRKNIRNELENAGSGTMYSPMMKDLAKKLDALDDMHRLLGKTEKGAELKAESFIRNINNLGKQERLEWLKNYEDLFGGDYAERAKMAMYSEQVGREGRGSFRSKTRTGRVSIGEGVNLPVGSPLLAGRVTLPFAQGLEDFTAKLAGVKKPVPKPKELSDLEWFKQQDELYGINENARKDGNG